MDMPTVSTHRRLLGEGAQRLWPPRADERAVQGQPSDGLWTFLSGLPSEELNLAVVSDDDPDLLSGCIGRIAAGGLSVSLFLADAARALAPSLESPWRSIGSVPLMAIDLRSATFELDERVTVARPTESNAVLEVIEDAFGIPTETYRPLLEATVSEEPADERRSGVLHAGEAGTWVLSDPQLGVTATVTTVRRGETVSVWSMATCQRARRQGHGRALLGHVLAEAVACGASTGLLFASPDGQPLYEAMGWRSLEVWDAFTNVPPSEDGESLLA